MGIIYPLEWVKMKTKITIEGGADYAVGITPISATIAISDNVCQPSETDKTNLIKFFSEYYDVPHGAVKVASE